MSTKRERIDRSRLFTTVHSDDLDVLLYVASLKVPPQSWPEDLSEVLRMDPLEIRARVEDGRRRWEARR